MANSPRYTKQRVLDLNNIKAPPRGIRLEEPPIVINCKHRKKELSDDKRFVRCVECLEVFDRQIGKKVE